MKKLGLILIIIILALIGISAIVMLVGRFMLHNTEISVRTQLLDEEEPQTILLFFAHPDDEIAVGGTLLAAVEAGHKLVMVYATKGEAGPTGGLVTQEELGQTREKEMKRVADMFGAEALEMFDFPDSGLIQIPKETFENLALEMIQKYRPDYVITYDSEVGLYGHPDHRVVASAMENVFHQYKEDDDFTVKKLYQVTLSPKQIDIALKIAPGFQKNYPKEGPGLPLPDFAVRTTPYFPILVKMMEAHATQQEVFRDLLPYREDVPAFIYARIFDREYFYEVK